MTGTYSLDVVVPLFNEADSVASLIAETRAALQAQPRIARWRLILVDDGSTDASWAAVVAAAAQNENLRALRLTRNFGKEAAIRAGLETSLETGKADFTVVMDADLQHPPALIGRMFDTWLATRCEIVSAVRTRFQSAGVLRRLGSVAYGGVFSWLAGIDLTDATDFKLLTRHAVERYCALRERRLFFRGLTSWLGLHEERVNFEVPAGNAAASSWSLGALARYAIRNTTAFSTTPLQIVLWMGVLSLLFSIALAGQTIYNKLSHQAAEGFTTIIIAVSFFGGLTLLGLGVVGIYVAALYDEVKARPIYLVAERAGVEEHGQESTRA
jgi:polyisoprenyl-phosphate glycosyltransferase